MPTMSVLPALALATMFGLAAPTAASAASAAVARVAEVTPPVRPVSLTEAEDDGGTCSRIRRRLWIEGEGWVVRRITTCR